MKKAKSCGAIIFYFDGDEFLFLIIKHIPAHGGHWDFPKGHVELGEAEETTALREVKEETGLDVNLISGFKEQIKYVDNINHVDKTVIYFLGISSTKQVVCQETEISCSEWLSYELASEKLTFENSRILLNSAYDFLIKNHASMVYSK